MLNTSVKFRSARSPSSGYSQLTRIWFAGRWSRKAPARAVQRCDKSPPDQEQSRSKSEADLVVRMWQPVLASARASKREWKGPQGGRVSFQGDRNRFGLPFRARRAGPLINMNERLVLVDASRR